MSNLNIISTEICGVKYQSGLHIYSRNKGIMHAANGPAKSSSSHGKVCRTGLACDVNASVSIVRDVEARIRFRTAQICAKHERTPRWIECHHESVQGAR